MFKKIKNILKSKVLSKHEKNKLSQKSISFHGGFIPIVKTEEEDVFIVGFPKSGNTLMQHIIAHLVYGINEEGSRSMINLIVPDIYANTHYFRFNNVCFFKSHELPKENYKRVIYIMRDGREALLSYYHMMKNMGKDISLEDLYKGKIKIYGGLWHEHINAWEQNPYNAEILFLKYEDLLKNKLSEINKICDFLSINRTDEELKKVISNTTLEHMKELESRKDWVKMKEGKFIYGKSFVRKGDIDSYKKEVSNDLNSIFEAKNRTILNKYY